MDRFLKHTVQSGSPVLPAPKKPKVSSNQDYISASFRAQELGKSFYESGGKLFCECSPHYSPNLPHIKQFKASAALHFFAKFCRA